MLKKPTISGFYFIIRMIFYVAEIQAFQSQHIKLQITSESGVGC